MADRRMPMLCCSQLCAVQDAANLCVNPTTGEQTVCAMSTPGSNAMMNAGVMVARPSDSLLKSFKAHLAKLTKPYATLPEQEFLSDIYLKGMAYKEPEKNRFQFIPSSYGQCWANAAQLGAASIVHNCGPFKYGHHGLCSWDGESGSTSCLERLLVHSEGKQRAKEPERQKVLGLYQDLLGTANPCSAHGRDATTCSKAPMFGEQQQCGWCGDDVRCIPKAACLPSTPAKTAQAERWQLYLREREWMEQQELLNKRRHLASGGPPLPPGYSTPPMPPGLAGPPGSAPPFMMGGPPPGLMPTLTVLASPPPPVSQSPAAASPTKVSIKSQPPPSPSPPAMPPATPGTAYAQRVTTRFVLSGTVETFDKDGFRTALLNIFTSAVNIKLTVTPASVSVDAQIDFATKDAADSAATTINATPVAQMQSTWFAAVDITIENNPSASVAIAPTATAAVAEAVAAASNASTSSGLNAGEVFGVLAGVVAVGLVALCLIRKFNKAKVQLPQNLKPHKVRVIPADAAQERPAQEALQPLVAVGEPVDASQESAVVAEEGAQALPKRKRVNLKVDLPVAGAPESIPLASGDTRIPPLSPARPAYKEEEEKSETASESAGSTQMTGSAPPAPQEGVEMMAGVMGLMSEPTPQARATILAPTRPPPSMASLPPIAGEIAGPLPPIKD